MSAEVIKVLLVEDDASDAAGIRRMLEDSQNPVFCIEIVDQVQPGFGRLTSGGIDIVLLNLSLPDSQGLDTFTHFNTHFPYVPFVVLADTNDEDLAIRVVKDGAQDYFVKKDLNRAQLVRAIVYALQRNVASIRKQQTIARLEDLSETKSQFVAEASHELRTPLAIVREFVSLVHDEVVGPVVDKQKECLASAIRNCDRLTELINKMLDLAKIEAGRMELNRDKTDVSRLLKLCYEDFLPKTRARGQNLFYDIPDSLPAAYCDSNSVSNVLINLVGNACKFTPDGGTIRLGCQQEGQFLAVWVQDNGRGIPPEAKEKIFQAFYQFDRENGPGAKGTGLGLAIAKHLVELNGGYMSVDSEPGKGSKFSFMLPLYQKEAVYRILIVDDEEMIVRTVMRYLNGSKLNLDIKSTFSGLEGLIIAGQFNPDLVILDVNMVEVGGMKVLSLFREKMYQGCGKVLLMSGDENALKEYKEKGADDFLAKPFTSADLIKKLVSLLKIERRRR